jgi:hypothetical protein
MLQATSSSAHQDTREPWDSEPAVTSEAIEEAQAEIVVGLRDVLVRKGDGKQWLVKAFQVPLLSAAR